jgi:mono/diheme cytochrome c family protein
LKSLVVLLILSAGTAFADATPDGASIYKAKCAICHGADGKKTSEALGVKDLTSEEVQKNADDELYAIIANGKGKMPAYKSKLTDADIKALVVHIRDLAKK